MNHGANGTLVTAVPNAGYHFTTWSDGVLTAARTDLSVTGNITVMASFQVDPIGNPLIAHYAMEEGSGTALVDSSTHSNHGSLTGGPTWVAGVRGQAMDFNGTTQYGVVPDAGSLDITDSITLAAWVKPEQLATQYLVKKATNGGTNGYELSLSSSGSSWPNKVFFRFNQATSGDTYRINSTTLYPYGGSTWIHIAGTYDGTTMRLYVNGVQESSLATTIAIAANSLGLGIGAQADGVSKFMGQMDDVRIYHRALSASEIAALATTATHTITATAGPNGAIAPVGAVVVAHGASQTFTITPAAGYHILDVLADGASAGAVGTYTFNNVTTNHTIAASFQITNLAPNQPVLVAPINMAIGVSTSPSLQVSVTDPDANNMTVTFYGRPIVGTPPNNYVVLGANAGVLSGSTTSVTWPGLLPVTAYEWYVTAYDGVATTTGSTWSFTTMGTVPVITSTAATAGVVGQAYSYDVDASGTPAPTFSLLVFPAGMTINPASGLIAWTPGTAGDFNVSVQALNLAGSDTQSYAIHVTEVPVIISTAAVAGVVGQLYSYDVNATGSPAPTYSLLVFPAGMTINPASGLIQWTPGAAGDFNVSVQALNTAGSDTQSYAIHVTLLPQVPTLISPPTASLTADDTPTFVWSSTAGGGGTYTLQYATNAPFTTGLVTVSGLAATTYTVPGGSPLADGIWYWHVQAVDAASNASGYQTTPFSLTVDTTPPAIPTLLSPANLAVLNDNTPALSWTTTAGPGGTYTLEYAIDPLFVTAVTIPGFAGPPYTVVIPLADGDYYWHVSATDQAGNESAYQGAAFRFTIDAGAPTIPFLLSPPNLSFTTDTTPTFVWSHSTPVTASAERGGSTELGAALPGTYTLQYSMNPSFTVVTTVENIAETTYTVPGTSPMTRATWYWRVEAIDQGGNHSGYQGQASRYGIFLAADVNMSGQITSADIIQLVNYVFKSGANPLPCAAAGDLNCDGSVTASDIIVLVNFVFKGGTPPCQVGDLIASGIWDCP